MKKKNRNRLMASIISGLAFLFVFVLSVQNPPQKRGRTIELLDS